VGATVAAVAVIGSLTLTSHEEASAATLVSTAAVPVAVGSDNPPAPTNPADMPMDMPGMDMSGSHEHSDATGAAAHRPLVPVLGTFGGATSAVLLTAGMMRHKDRELSLAKKATRRAGRAKK
jgi:hypothetical protein